MYKHVRNVSTVRKLRLQFDKLQPNFDINEHQVTTYELLFFFKQWTLMVACTKKRP